MTQVFITSEYIKLDSFLKLCGEAGSGGMAKMIISDGLVSVNGETCLMRGRKLRPGDVVETDGNSYSVCSEESENDN